jgi:predicted nucleic acid-binding protein
VKPVLLDTSAIVAALDRSEVHHEPCAAALAEVAGSLVTCEAVIAEACYLLRGVAGAPEAILQNVERGVFHVPFALSASAGAVRKLLVKYRRVPMDFADGCLVEMADLLDTGARPSPSTASCDGSEVVYGRIAA